MLYVLCIIIYIYTTIQKFGNNNIFLEKNYYLRILKKNNNNGFHKNQKSQVNFICIAHFTVHIISKEL